MELTVLLLLLSNFCLCTHAVELLSAYIGAVNIPSAAFARVSGCNPDGGIQADGMPVTFDVPINASSMVPDQFAIIYELPVNVSGNPRAVYYPACATLEPANEDDEGHTVLLTGNFIATVSDALPQRVEIVESASTGMRLHSRDGQDLVGLRTTKIVYGAIDGPNLALALWHPNVGRNGQVQTVWEGGITAESGAAISNGLLPHFFLVDRDGRRHNPASFEDVGDGDNYLVLNLPDDFEGRPERVDVDTGTVYDPLNVPNPENTTAIVRDVFEDSNQMKDESEGDNNKTSNG